MFCILFYSRKRLSFIFTRHLLIFYYSLCNSYLIFFTRPPQFVYFGFFLITSGNGSFSFPPDNKFIIRKQLYFNVYYKIAVPSPVITKVFFFKQLPILIYSNNNCFSSSDNGCSLIYPQTTNVSLISLRTRAIFHFSSDLQSGCARTVVKLI